MKLSILMTGKAYLPEAYAYSDFLTKREWEVKLCVPGEPDYDCDVLITFQPERMPRRGLRCKVIHEYHSLPTGKHPRFRRAVKKLLSRKPDGRIFLNETVRNHLCFRDNTPFINRDMGVDELFFEETGAAKEFDIVYCGSIQRRAGLTACINALTANGHRLLLIGEPGEAFERALTHPELVTMIGRVERRAIPAQVRRARYGLNFTPDIYPLNIQTSTKTLEYFAAGLGVISNRYEWSQRFALDQNAPMLWLDDVLADPDMLGGEAATLNVANCRWSTLLEQAGFEDFLRSLVQRREY
jgi:hypothetical protein